MGDIWKVTSGEEFCTSHPWAAVTFHNLEFFGSHRGGVLCAMWHGMLPEFCLSHGGLAAASGLLVASWWPELFWQYGRRRAVCLNQSSGCTFRGCIVKAHRVQHCTSSCSLHRHTMGRRVHFSGDVPGGMDAWSAVDMQWLSVAIFFPRKQKTNELLATAQQISHACS